MKRRVSNIVAAAAVSLAIGLQPASAAAAEIAVLPALPAERIETTTAPFDPICPLCFVREFLETFS
ncbi:hypothetical protein [Nocardia sp. NPDC002869]|uniref:hypothetical protein n=1 Tax=Nocardia sp. NPDC002869 TaxID=3161032 RepID=UPI00398D4539